MSSRGVNLVYFVDLVCLVYLVYLVYSVYLVHLVYLVYLVFPFNRNTGYWSLVISYWLLVTGY